MENTNPLFILVNKPVGWTSFDAVNYVRKKARIESGTKSIKVGHTGTLDPFASGLLIIGVGREATKRLDAFVGLPKTYIAIIHLGLVSDTQDVTGEITDFPVKPGINATPTLEEITNILTTFKGKQLQIPPMHSAKKVGGERLYKLARQGKEIERLPNEIEIYDLKLLDYSWPLLKIEVACSAGTYIRTVAHDIGQKLGVGAYCEGLIRTKIGTYLLENAQNIEAVDFTKKIELR